MQSLPNLSHHKKPLKPQTILEFQNAVWDYYTNNKRDFLWRQTSDPYKILVSEVMLQQTQTARVTTYYENFLKTFPTIKDLANSTLGQVLTLWQGLGYNRRAQYLHTTTKHIVNNYSGMIPHARLDLEDLTGIGPNTAGAIMAYAFNQPVVFIETNIRTVFLYTFFRDQEQILDKQLLELIEQTLDKNCPRDWYYALTDYGVYIKSQIVNPSRKSKHYAKQSTFEGSQRQIRAAIVRFLVSKKSASKIQILSLEYDKKDIETNLEKLVNENMVTRNGSQYVIE